MDTDFYNSPINKQKNTLLDDDCNITNTEMSAKSTTDVERYATDEGSCRLIIINMYNTCKYLIFAWVFTALGIVLTLLSSHATRYLVEFAQNPLSGSELLENGAANGIRINKSQSLQWKHWNRQFEVAFLEPFHEVAESSIEFTLPDPKCEKEERDTLSEALSTLRLAQDLKRQGKRDKAERLFTHALALQPNHPEVLVQYGLFLEAFNKDVVQAERLYTRALTISPTHEVARRNRHRTLPLVEEIDNHMLNIIDHKRDFFIRIPRENSALKRAKREAYIKHVYHTVALEGNTMSLIETRVILETRLAIAGKSILEHNEILGLDAALRYLNQTLFTRRSIGMITVDEILNLHLRILGHVDPTVAGQFRTTQVFVGNFVPIPPAEVPQAVEEFVQWVNSEAALNLHPVEMAAIAHYKFVFIHPFIDGNGRTSRLIMNWILMQAGFPPVVILVEERLQYYETLRMANEGDLRPFIRFIAKCTEQTLDEYLSSALESPAIENELKSLWSNSVHSQRPPIAALDLFNRTFLNQEPFDAHHHRTIAVGAN